MPNIKPNTPVTIPNKFLKIIPAEEGEVYNLYGKNYPITEYYQFGENGAKIPLVDIPMVSDFKWQYDCLMDRINNPDKYRMHCDENVEDVIEHGKQWLRDHIEGASELEESKRIELHELLYSKTNNYTQAQRKGV